AFPGANPGEGPPAQHRERSGPLACPTPRSESGDGTEGRRDARLRARLHGDELAPLEGRDPRAPAQRHPRRGLQRTYRLPGRRRDVLPPYFESVGLLFSRLPAPFNSRTASAGRRRMEGRAEDHLLLAVAQRNLARRPAE